MDSLDKILQRLTTEQFSDLDLPKTPKEWELARAKSFNESYGTLHEEDGYNCEICRNKGAIMCATQLKNETWTTAVADCKCMKVRRTIRRMERSGLKNIIRDYKFELFDTTDDWQKAIKNAAMQYAKELNGWFCIGGQPGCGKTHICTAICRELLLSGKDVRYMLWLDDVIKLKGCITDAEEYTDMLGKFKTVEVLYIDDFFKTGKNPSGEKQPPSGADIRLAMELLNYRYINHLPTIISTEYKIGDLVDIDEAIGSRINERARESGGAFNINHDRKKNYRLRGIIEL